jgi:hypothetical protein
MDLGLPKSFNDNSAAVEGFGEKQNRFMIKSKKNY